LFKANNVLHAILLSSFFHKEALSVVLLVRFVSHYYYYHYEEYTQPSDSRSWMSLLLKMLNHRITESQN